MNLEKAKLTRQMLKPEHNYPGSIYRIRDTWYRIGPHGNSIRLTDTEITVMQKIGEQIKQEAKQPA